jgi:shikimate kinase
MDSRQTSSENRAAAGGPSVVALTGFMAAGKSTIGRALASLLRWSFIDLDYEIESRAAMPIHAIFTKDGEAVFRRLEGECLRAVLSGVKAPTVIALGGGTFIQPDNSDALRQRGACVVFVQTDVEQLMERCRNAAERAQNPRPLARDEAALCALYEQRLPYYRQAELTIETRNKEADEAAREIALALNLLTTGKRA